MAQRSESKCHVCGERRAFARPQHVGRTDPRCKATTTGRSETVGGGGGGGPLDKARPESTLGSSKSRIRFKTMAETDYVNVRTNTPTITQRISRGFQPSRNGQQARRDQDSSDRRLQAGGNVAVTSLPLADERCHGHKSARYSLHDLIRCERAPPGVCPDRRSQNSITYFGQRTAFANTTQITTFSYCSAAAYGGDNGRDRGVGDRVIVGQHTVAERARTVVYCYIDALNGDIETIATATLNGTTAVASAPVRKHPRNTHHRSGDAQRGNDHANTAVVEYHVNKSLQQ